MNKYPCQTCKKNANGCYRTVGKQGDKYICGDYDPVVDCGTCKHDGQQMVSRDCLKCTDDKLNWTLKI